MLGITDLPPGAELPKRLIAMMYESTGVSTELLEVVVLGTEETQDLQLQVSTKALQEMS